QKLEQKIQNYNTKNMQLQITVKNLEQETAGTCKIEIEKLQEKQKEKENLRSELEAKYQNLKMILNHNQTIANNLPQKIKAYENIKEKYQSLEGLYTKISGTLTGEEKLTFEAYVQQYYFQRVISNARQRLIFLTDNKFDLRHRESAKNKNSKSGLDLEILDRATGQWRDVTTLSGGESFMLALSLALGLSDAIQESSGGIQIDAMFIDEGFGTLDETALNQAIALLGKLADGKRLIGVISHVESLINRIESKIYVTKKAIGSEIII
nr:SMC family ATPase [Oscillospiraceae bacterium]